MKKFLLKFITPALFGVVMMNFYASAVTGSGLSLDALILEALENNPDIRAVRAWWEAEEARIEQANALDDPELGFDTWNIPSDFDL